MARIRFIAAFVVLIGGVIFAAAPRAAYADVTLEGNDPSALELGVGGFDVLHNYTAAEFRGEYRFSQSLWLFRPLIGVEGTTKGTVYGYAGLALDIFLGSHFVLTPNEAVGAWTRGDGKELGNVVEFRSGGEIDYRFNNSSRLGVSFHHISNAGLGKHNPGEEEALFLYSMPFSMFP